MLCAGNLDVAQHALRPELAQVISEAHGFVEHNAQARSLMVAVSSTFSPPNDAVWDAEQRTRRLTVLP